MFTYLWIFKCPIKWNLRGALKFNIECLFMFTFLLNSFLHSFTPLRSNKCTIMQIFKYNSIVTPSSTFISTWNTPSCASLYRSQGTPLGVPSDEPLVASTIALTNEVSSAPSSATSNESFFSPSPLSHLQWLFKVNPKVHLQV